MLAMTTVNRWVRPWFGFVSVSRSIFSTTWFIFFRVEAIVSCAADCVISPEATRISCRQLKADTAGGGFHKWCTDYFGGQSRVGEKW